MSVQIAKELTQQLLNQPETGMGWQLVELRLGAGRPHHAIVLNAQEAIETPGRSAALREGEDKDIKKRLLQLELKYPSPQLTLRALTSAQARHSGLLSGPLYKAGSGPASEAPVEQSAAGERFMRFSAYQHDNRIRPDGSVRPSTYVTTHLDGIQVKTGVEALERYALPNPEPAVHRYHLKPPQPIAVQRGTVQAAYGHQGGGVEVIFVTGAPAGTKDYQDRIPSGKEGEP